MKKHAATIALLALACFLCWWRPSPNSPAQAAQEGLVISPEALQFGTAWETQEFPWKVCIQNTSGADINITGFSTLCSCLSCNPKSLCLGPGDHAELRLTLDLSRAFARLPPDSEEAPFETEFTPIIAGRQNIVPGWVIRGMVRRPVIPARSPFVIKDRLVRGEPFPVQIVSLQGPPFLPRRRMECSVRPAIGVRVPSSCQGVAGEP